MKKFARTFKTKEVGQILLHAVKEGENCPDEPAHLQLCFLHPETGVKCIINDTMKYKKAVKIVNKVWKSTVVEIALDVVSDLNGESIAYEKFCEDLERRNENGELE